MGESRLTTRIADAINERHRCRAIKMHGSEYMPRGTPDILAVVRGFTIFLEVKLPGNKLTPMQEHQSREWRKAFAIVKTVYSFEEAMCHIDKLDNIIRWGMERELLGLLKPIIEETYVKAGDTESDG